MAHLPLLLLCVVAAASSSLTAAAVVLRGLDPAQQPYYSQAATSGSFTALDGSKTIPFSQVNDGYCDTGDGSDEPGTSACHNGRFYCRNLGHEPRLLGSSFVDDGICDCCDGADEPKGTCTNTCLAASAAHRETLKKDVDHYAAALSIKEGYIAQAAEYKQQLRSRAPFIDEELARAQERLERLRVEKAAVEAEEQKMHAAHAEARRLAEEQRAAEQQQASDLGAETGSEAHSQESEHAEPQHEETDEERGRRIASQWTHDPEAATAPVTAHGTEGEVAAATGEEGSEEYDHSHASEYDSEPYEGEHQEKEEARPGPAADAQQQQEQQQEQLNQQQQQQAAAEPQDYEARSEWDDFMLFYNAFWRQLKLAWERLGHVARHGIRVDVRGDREQEVAEQIAQIEAQVAEERRLAALEDAALLAQMQKEGEEQQALAAAAKAKAEQQWYEQQRAKAQAQKLGQHHRANKERSAAAAAAGSDASTPAGEVRAAFYDAEQTLSRLKKEKEDISVLLAAGLDFGPNDIFLAPAFTGRCFESHQTRWIYEACFFKGATQREGHDNRVNIGKWQGFSVDGDRVLAVWGEGDTCWNVGPRSFKVELTCGHDNRLHDAEEPTTCGYAAKMTTPAVCSEAELARLKDTWQQLLNQESIIAEQIARDAAQHDEL